MLMKEIIARMWTVVIKTYVIPNLHVSDNQMKYIISSMLRNARVNALGTPSSVRFYKKLGW